jgi:hypothetical protein
MFDPTDPSAPMTNGRPDSPEPPASDTPVPPAVERFNSCRWKSQEQGRYCTHRDVLPLAGRDGFKPEAWCPDCTFFKIRRTPKKRDNNGFTY